MRKRGFDPTACLPSAAALRRRIGALQAEFRRLGILLVTAEQLERSAGTPSRDAIAPTNMPGVANGR
ncbi:MAG TPA: hypothetical protein VGG64_07715 [Pirellulales bacterium]|jgi:hypothetical protein